MDGNKAAASGSTAGALDSLPQSMNRLCLSNAQREGRESVWEGRVTSGDPAGVDHIITTHSTDTNIPRETIRYRTERVVGNGSFGVVYQARCLETGELVAIKKVLQDKRFKNRELQIIRRLQHPNIVQLKHCFYSSGATAGPGSGPTAAPRGTSPAPPAPDDVYLNLVLEFVPDTVYKIINTIHVQMIECQSPWYGYTSTKCFVRWHTFIVKACVIVTSNLKIYWWMCLLIH